MGVGGRLLRMVRLVLESGEQGSQAEGRKSRGFGSQGTWMSNVRETIHRHGSFHREVHIRSVDNSSSFLRF